MANQPTRRRKRISLPGMISGISRDELRKHLFPEDPSASPTLPEFIVKEVKPVQECGNSHTQSMNISKPEGDKSHLSSLPVSEYGQRGRNYYRDGGSNPVSDESCSGRISEETQNEFICTDGPEDSHESKDDVESNIRQKSSNFPSQVNKSVNQAISENCYFDLPPTNLLQCENSHPPNEQDSKTPKEHGYERNEEDSHDIPSTGSFFIPSSEISFTDSLKDMLTSLISQKSVRDSTKHSDILEELINSFVAHHPQSLQAKPSITNQENKESIKTMLISLMKKVWKQNDIDIPDISYPSVHSLILMLSVNSEKHSLDPTTRQLLSLISPDNEMSAILKAECYEPNCSKSLCQEVQQCLRRLQDIDVSVADLSKDEVNVLCCMHDHCQSCKYLHCPLYWCQKEAPFGKKDRSEILATMKQLVEHGYHGNFLDDLKNGTFAKFVQDLPLKAVPRELYEWSGLCRLTGANNTILVQSTMEEREEYWIMKKCQMYKSHSQMDLYETLGQISHKGIAQHLWTAFCPDQRYMAVCMGFEAFSLYERLQESPIKNLHIVVRIMLQLICTTKQLHERGILYLNWSSKNIVYSTAEHVKLTNFTCSAIKSRIDEDIADISLSLPRQLIAPEMLEAEPKADEKTDVRGLGCLLKEIFSGQPVWYEHLHEPDNVLHKKIMEDIPSKPDDCLELFNTFRVCWERQRSSRPSLEELEIYLVQAKDKQANK